MTRLEAQKNSRRVATSPAIGRTSSVDSRKPAADQRAIALYGGTFDPIHIGHAKVASAARRAFGFAELRLLPAARPPLRGAPGASAAQRLAMVRLVCAARAKFVSDGRELRREGQSFTVDTLAELRAELGPRQPLAWLVGADAVAQLHRWHRYEALLTLAHLVVLDRPDAPAPNAEVAALLAAHRSDDRRDVHRTAAGRVFHFLGPRVPVSSTQVRAALAAGRSVAGLLPPKVWAYIRREHLYGVDRPVAARTHHAT